MKPFNIFKSGQHTAMSGVTLDFTDDMLREAAESYNPDLHEAPIVVGHPKDNAPAFGWIGGLSFKEGKGLFADPRQVNQDFEELVQAGTYKKVSASLYTPDSPANPTPGKYYIRHVGFLGGQPPAIKGLEGVQFSDADEGTLEFAADYEIAGVFRRLREFLIEKFGIEEADKAIPDWMVQSAEDVARHPSIEDAPAASFSEPSGDTTMTEEEIKAAKAQLEAEQAKLKADQESFAEQQEAAAAVAIAQRKQGLVARVDELVKAGKILPAKRAAVVAFAESINQDATVEFGEGDDATSESATDFFFELIGSGKSPVSFTEQSRATSESNNTDDIGNSEELAARALQFQEEERSRGRTISITQAVNHVQGLED